MKFQNIVLLSVAAFIIWPRNGAGIGAIKKTKYLPVYDGDKVNTALQLKAAPGVYIIKKNGVIRYVGMSASNVYKTMLRHFQQWDDPKQVRVTYSKNDPGIKARVIYCTPQQAARLERALIVKHQPQDNPNKYNNYVLDLADDRIIENVKYSEEIAPF